MDSGSLPTIREYLTFFYDIPDIHLGDSPNGDGCDFLDRPVTLFPFECPKQRGRRTISYQLPITYTTSDTETVQEKHGANVRFHKKGTWRQQ